MKRIIITLLALVGLAWLLYTPDIDTQELEQRYAQSPSRFLKLADGSRIHYREQGQLNAPVLLLIHGTSASLHTWEPLNKLLGDQFRLISLDLLGHGLTGASKQRHYAPEAQIDAILALMDHLQIASASLAGNSFGGNIAWRLALANPDRVNSLVLIAPSGVPRETPSKSNLGFKLLSSPIAQKLMLKVTPRWILARSLRQTLQDETLVSDAMIDRYWHLLRRPGNRQAMVDLARGRKASDKWQNLDQIQHPVLLVWGEQDQILPVSMANTFVAKLPDLRFEKLDKIGHIPMEEAPIDVARLITDFCGKNEC